jgi:hypothetical protein
MSVGMTVYPW